MTICSPSFNCDALRQRLERGRRRVVAGHDRLHVARLDRDGNAAVEIGEQDHPGRMIAGEKDAPDHAARIDDRLAGLDACALPASRIIVSRNGRLARPMTCAVTAAKRGIGHRIEQKLIALQPLLEHERRVLPLPQPRVFFLEAQIFLIDVENVRRRRPTQLPTGVDGARAPFRARAPSSRRNRRAHGRTARIAPCRPARATTARTATDRERELGAAACPARFSRSRSP